jgi:short-subunit dehydrogenase
VSSFGQIDVWVNNAGVYLLGKFDRVPADAFRELVDTNFFGAVNGTRAALPHLKATRGVLINVASMASAITVPYGSAYVSSKWALRGFSASLRQELAAEGVEVVTVMPASIDTPLFEHAANYTGRVMQPMPPVYAAEDVARTIVASARRPRPEVPVGKVVNASRVLRTVLPARTHERLTARKAERDHFLAQPAPDRRGNLEQPAPPFAVDGGWRRRKREKGRTGKVVLAVGLALAAVPAALALAPARQRQRWLTAVLG